jgi:biotin carboxyl carrier protein
MKIEGPVWAGRDAVVRAIHVKHGDTVATKGLLMEMGA